MGLLSRLRGHELVVLGNSLVDYVAHVDSDFVKRHGFEEGTSFPINRERRLLLEERHPYERYSGGSAANTAAAFANLGGNAAFMGIVAKDDNGKFFCKDLKRNGVKTYIKKQKHGRTGVVIDLVTENERTLAFDLNDRLQLLPKELPHKAILRSDIFHSTGYVADSMYKTLYTAMRFASHNNKIVSFDLGAEFIVEENRRKLEDMIYLFVDVLFANADEARGLVGMKPYSALDEISKLNVDIVVVKMGVEGSLIMHKDRIYRMPSFFTKVANTTGAGDAYAGAFLYGLARGDVIRDCAQMGSYYAARVVANELSKLDYKVDIKNAFR